MQTRFFDDIESSEPCGLVIFDRDGTLIENLKGLKNLLEIRWKNGVLELLKELHAEKYLIAIATNQGAVEEGLLTLNHVDAIHDQIILDAKEAGARIWAIAYCPHGKNLTGLICDCRKPKAGMLDELIGQLGHPELPTFFIGDSDSDRLAAINSKYGIKYLSVETLYDGVDMKKDWF
jgi:D-glycero-D-manno-heptose 1,7-bisphosphate phosphatase